MPGSLRSYNGGDRRMRCWPRVHPRIAPAKTMTRARRRSGPGQAMGAAIARRDSRKGNRTPRGPLPPPSASSLDAGQKPGLGQLRRVAASKRRRARGWSRSRIGIGIAASRTRSLPRTNRPGRPRHQITERASADGRSSVRVSREEGGGIREMGTLWRQLPIAVPAYLRVRLELSCDAGPRAGPTGRGRPGMWRPLRYASRKAKRPPGRRARRSSRIEGQGEGVIGGAVRAASAPKEDGPVRGPREHARGPQSGGAGITGRPRDRERGTGFAMALGGA